MNNTPLEDKAHDVRRNNFNVSSRIRENSSSEDDKLHRSHQKKTRNDKKSKTMMKFHGEKIPLPAKDSIVS